jgi:hypothetical protein
MPLYARASCFTSVLLLCLTRCSSDLPLSGSDHAMYGAFREVFEYMNLFLEERWGVGPS